MEQTQEVSSVAEWLRFPELAVRPIQAARDEGLITTVLKVGFLVVSQVDCVQAGVFVTASGGDKCRLPTAVIVRNGEPVVHRLPLDLANWVVECVELGKRGKKLFPSKVEFGRLRRKVFAEFRPG